MSENKDFVIENGVLKKYNGPGGEVVIPEGVTEIGWGAFQNCTGLQQVTLPKGLTAIKMRAFAGCTSLTEIDLPDSVSEIGQEAFWGCTGLTRFTVPKGVSFLGGDSTGYNVFVNCHKLKDLRVAEGNPHHTAKGARCTIRIRPN